jgi:hypothetical protein
MLYIITQIGKDMKGNKDEDSIDLLTIATKQTLVYCTYGMPSTKPISTSTSNTQTLPHKLLPHMSSSHSLLLHNSYARQTKQMQHWISWACSDVLPEIWVTCLWSVSPNFNLLNKYVIHQNLLFVSVVALILYPTLRWTPKTWDLYKVKDALPTSILLLGHPTSCSPLPHNPCNQTLCKPYSRPKWDWFQFS